MNATQIILLCTIVILVIMYPILISSRNKKENEKLQQQTNSLKKGDRVLTTSGVYGTIVDLRLENDRKIVTIETGTKDKKGYIAIEAFAIYTVFENEPAQTQKAVEVKPADVEVDAKQIKTTLEKVDNKEDNAKKGKKKEN